jgi:hypothetical protein
VKAATTAAADYVRQRVNIYMCALINVQIPAAAAALPVEGGTESAAYVYVREYNVYVLRRCAGYLTYPTTNSSVCRLLLLELQKLNSSRLALCARFIFFVRRAPSARRRRRRAYSDDMNSR